MAIPRKDFVEYFEPWKRCWENCVWSQGVSLWRGLRYKIVLCTMFLVSCIFFSKCLYFSYHMIGYFLDRPCMSLCFTFWFLFKESPHTHPHPPPNNCVYPLIEVSIPVQSQVISVKSHWQERWYPFPLDCLFMLYVILSFNILHFMFLAGEESGGKI